MVHYLETVTKFLQLFGSGLVEVTISQLQDIPNSSSCSGGSDSCTFPPLFLSYRTWAEEKPLQSSLKPSSIQERSNSQNLGKRQQMWSPTGVSGLGLSCRHIPAPGEERNQKDLQELVAEPPLPPMGADSMVLLCSPSPGRTPLKALRLFAFGGFLSLKIKINPSTWLELWALNQYP